MPEKHTKLCTTSNCEDLQQQKKQIKNMTGGWQVYPRAKPLIEYLH